MAKMTIATKRCFLCGQVGAVTAEASEVAAWAGGRGPFIQEAMPTTPVEIREQILTGTHPACWAKAFPEED